MIHIGQHTHPLSHRFERKPGFDHWTLALMRSGSSYLEYEGKVIHKLAPCITLTPPQTTYRVRFGGIGAIWSESWAFFPPSPTHNSLAQHLLPIKNAPLYLPLSPEIATVLESQFQLLFAYDQIGISNSLQLMDHGIAGILLTIGSLTTGKIDPRLREAAAFLSADLDRSMALAQVAKQVGMSPSNLSHLFKSSFAVTPIRYRETQRLKHAASLLLATDLPLKDIAIQSGFSDAFHFSRRFRNHFGQSPSQYRQTDLN